MIEITDLFKTRACSDEKRILFLNVVLDKISEMIDVKNPTNVQETLDCIEVLRIKVEGFTLKD